MTDEWIKKMWDIDNGMLRKCGIHIMECYLLSAGKWMELENFMLSKVGQAQKDIQIYISFYTYGSI
jgi:hypothetical protein